MVSKILKKYQSLDIVTKATLWFLICSIFQKGFVFITTPIFTKLMNTSQYGEYSIYLSWVQIILLITSLRLDFAVFNKGMSKYENDKDGYTLTMQTISSIITVLVIIVYILFFNKVNHFIGLNPILIILMIAQVFFMNAISFWTIKQRYNYRYISVVIVTLLITIFDLMFGIITVINSSNKGFFRIISLATVNIIIGAIIYIYNIVKGKKLLKGEYLTFAIVFNVPLLPHYLSMYILQQSDKIMIQKLLGFSYVGLYSVAYSFATAVNILTNSITQSLTPWVYTKLKEKKLNLINIRLTKLFIYSGILILLFILLAPDLMNIMVSKQYHNAIFLIIPVSLSVMLTLIYGFFATIEFYYDKNKFSMIISGIAAITNIILNWLFIPKYGYIFAGYSTLVCYMILMLGHILYTNLILNRVENYVFYTKKQIFFIVFIVIITTIFFNLLYIYAIFRYFIIIIMIIILIVKRKKILLNILAK